MKVIPVVDGNFQPNPHGYNFLISLALVAQHRMTMLFNAELVCDLKTVIISQSKVATGSPTACYMVHVFVCIFSFYAQVRSILHVGCFYS